MQAQIVGAGQILLDARAIGQVQVAGHEGVVHAQRVRQIPRDVAVAGTDHAGVGFGQQEDVGFAQKRVCAEGFQQTVKPCASLHVPGYEAVVGTGGLRGRAQRAPRLRACPTGWSTFWCVQHPTDIRLQRAVQIEAPQLGAVAAGGQRRQVRRDTLAKDFVQVLGFGWMHCYDCNGFACGPRYFKNSCGACCCWPRSSWRC